MTALAKIHIAKKQLGMDEDSYRAVLLRVVGQPTAKGLNAAQCDEVIAEFTRLGFRPSVKGASKGRRRKLDGKYAPKLRALWIAGWNLGIIADNTDAAMISFVKRQAKVDDTRFLHHYQDANSAIEGLRGWLSRKGGVDWSGGNGLLNGYRIAKAQWALLGGDPAAFLHEACRIAGHNSPALFQQESDWHDVMNAFGRQIRATQKGVK